MPMKTLFLAWQDKAGSRHWFPIGRLDADASDYRFRYVSGSKRAQQEAGFRPLRNFPRWEEDYRSPELFAMFKNRVMWPSRPDFASYLQSMDLSRDASPIDMLSVSGGHRVTDAYEVFPKLVKKPDGSFVCRFFLHGGRHVTNTAQKRLGELQPKEELYLAVEVTNPLGELALQIQTTDYHMIGWAPRYLAHDLTLVEPHGQWGARVVRLNPMPAASEQRVLIELNGHWNEEHEPMTGPDFQPLVG